MNHDILVDLFFTITAAAVILITVLIAVVLIYAISIIYSLRRIIRSAEFAAEMIKEDLSELRQNLKTHGLSLRALLGFLKSLGRRRIKRK